MSITWTQPGNHSLAEQSYARAYERAVMAGSLDSIISWELGGFRAEDGSIAMHAPVEVKNRLRRNPLFAELLRQVDYSVQKLRDARFSFGKSSTTHFNV